MRLLLCTERLAIPLCVYTRKKWHTMVSAKVGKNAIAVIQYHDEATHQISAPEDADDVDRS